MRHSSSDIFVVIAITLFGGILAFVTPANLVAVRIWLLPLALVLPGYAFITAIYPRHSLEFIESILFILGISLVIMIIGGLLLNLTPFGLNANSWVVGLSGITLAASAVTLIRRRRGSIQRPAWFKEAVAGLTLRQVLLLVLAIVVICGAVATSVIGAERQPYSGFTQLWLLPASGANSKNTIRLGVKNMQLIPMEYRLVINANGKVIKVWSAIDLKQNDTWQANLILSQVASKSSTKVQALLYRMDAPSKVYRSVTLWLGT